MRVAWSSKGPPPVMMVSGDNYFLRRRAVRQLVSQAAEAGYEVTFAQSESEVVDSISMSSTFGQPHLIVVGPNEVSIETIKSLIADPAPRIGVLIDSPDSTGAIKDLIHGAHQVSFNLPEGKKDLEKLAIKFVHYEADTLLKVSEALDSKLASALVKNVGFDFGMLSYEVAKVTALVRSRGGSKVTVADLQATVRGSAAAEMQPLREALSEANEVKTAKELDRIKQKSTSDPTMLLLRAKGGPADLGFQWLQAALLLQKGSDARSISSAMGVPEWAVVRDVIPTAKRWGISPLTTLVKNLAQIDRGVQTGIPSPWVACETALLQGCRSVSSR